MLLVPSARRTVEPIGTSRLKKTISGGSKRSGQPGKRPRTWLLSMPPGSASRAPTNTMASTMTATWSPGTAPRKQRAPRRGKLLGAHDINRPTDDRKVTTMVPAITPQVEDVFITTRHAFRTAVDQVAANAKTVLPACASRIDKAVQIVLQGDVELLPDGHARVASQCQGTLVYRIVNGTCDCPDFSRAPSNWCKHRIAAGIQKRARAMVAAPHSTTAVPQTSVPAIPASFVTTIHGKEFVQFAGLLAMAHAQGLVSLTAKLVAVTPELALARATATFADGRTFTEAADATPDNVNAGVKKHFARCALTRAKSRCLRDALNINMVAVEELE